MLFYYLLSTTSSHFHTTLKKIYIKTDKKMEIEIEKNKT